MKRQDLYPRRSHKHEGQFFTSHVKFAARN